MLYYTECYIDTIWSNDRDHLAFTIVPASNYRVEQIKGFAESSLLFVEENEKSKQCVLKPIKDLKFMSNQIWMKKLILQSKVSRLKVGLHTNLECKEGLISCSEVILL